MQAETSDGEVAKTRLTEDELNKLQEFEQEKARLAMIFLDLHEKIDQVRKSVRVNDEAQRRLLDAVESKYHIPRGLRWAIKSDGTIEIQGSAR